MEQRMSEAKNAVDQPRIEAAVREILLAIGEDPDRDGLQQTPARVARAYAEFFSGLHQDAGEILGTTFDIAHSEMVLVKDIPFYSTCEHHLVPFHGVAHVGYIPGPDGKVTGLSKLARVVDLYARRPQVQERLTTQVVEALEEHLNPRGARVVALEKPTDIEQTQWYFQRYIKHLPSGGEIVMMDRSWYNRAGVERVMGYCTQAQYFEFMREVPDLERMLVNSGIKLIKFWFSVTKQEQLARFTSRRTDPVRQWKLSPTDLASLDKWDDYTAAKEAMFFYTHTGDAPWTVIKSNDKKRARLEAMRYVLSQFDYTSKDREVVGTCDPLIVRSATDVFEEEGGSDPEGFPVIQ